jgi:hypothetical protein
MEISGQTMWLIVLTVGVVILAVAVAYGISRNRARTPAEKAVTEAATRAEYVREDLDRS